jgi:hypothetical protein
VVPRTASIAVSLAHCDLLVVVVADRVGHLRRPVPRPVFDECRKADPDPANPHKGPGLSFFMVERRQAALAERPGNFPSIQAVRGEVAESANEFSDGPLVGVIDALGVSAPRRISVDRDV